MALTDAQKADVRRFLGYADITQGYYSKLEGVFNAISADAEAQIGTVLADLATIESTLRASWGRQKVTAVEDVKLAGADEIIALRHEGNRLACHLGTILGVRIYTKPFTAGDRSGVARRG